MKFAQLVKNMCIHGNVEIRKMNEDGECTDTKWINLCVGLSVSDVEEWKNYTVMRIYSETFQRRYWNHVDTCACLIIEVEEHQ